MPNVKDWVPGSIVQAAVIGRSGAGKTFGAGTFPRPNFIDFDRGIATLRHPDFVAKYGVRNVEYYHPVERSLNNRGVPTAHNAFDDACKYFDEWMKPGKRDQFDSWVVDTGTTLSNAAMNKAFILLGSPQFKRMSGTHDQALNTGLVFPKIQDYGSERSLVEQFVQMVKDSGKHFLFLCHEKEVTNDDGTVIGRTMLLTGKSPEVVGAMFDNVWFLTVSGAGSTLKRTLTTQYDGIRQAKSRLGVPNGTEFSWDAINSAMEVVRKAQTAAAAK